MIINITINKDLVLEESSKFKSVPCNGIQNVDGNQLGFSCSESMKYGKGLGKFFIHTHRARSKYYSDITKVPISVRKFIDSTG